MCAGLLPRCARAPISDRARTNPPGARRARLAGAGPGAAQVYAIGGAGLLLGSEDAGKTWTRDVEADNIPSNFYKVKFFKDKGFILGSQGVLLRYTGTGAGGK